MSASPGLNRMSAGVPGGGLVVPVARPPSRWTPAKILIATYRTTVTRRGLLRTRRLPLRQPRQPRTPPRPARLTTGQARLRRRPPPRVAPASSSGGLATEPELRSR